MPYTLIKIGPLTVYTFGVFLALAILLATYRIWKRGRELGFSEEKLLDAVLVTLVGGIIGGKIRGYNFYGGLFGGLIAAYFYLRRQRYSIHKISEVAVPPFFLALSLSLFGLSYLTESLIFAILWVTFLIFEKKKIFAGLDFFGAGVGALGLWRFFQEPARLDRLVSTGLIIVGCWQLRGHLREVKMKKLPLDFINQLKNRLLRRQKEITEQLEDLGKEDPYLVPDRARYNPEMVADALEDAGHERMEVLKRALRDSLVEVRTALTRMRLGKYGICEKCGRPIDKARLKANPAAVTCLTCEEREGMTTNEGMSS